MASRVASHRFITLEYVLAGPELSGVRLGTQKRGNLAYLAVDIPSDQGPGLKGKMDPLRAKRTVSKRTRFCLPANLGETASRIAALSALSTPVSCDPPRKCDVTGVTSAV